MFAVPVVVRNGASVLVGPQDWVATNEPEDLSRNIANPTTITAAQLAAADFLFSNPATDDDIVLLPTAEEIIQQLILVGQGDCGSCNGQIVNTTVWAQHTPLVSSCGCPGDSARLPEGLALRRTFYRNNLNLRTPLYLEIPGGAATSGLTWETILDNIGEDVTVSPREAVLFHNFEWKTLVFWVLNSSPQQSLVGDATIATAIIECDPALITTATVGMRLYTGDNSVFVSADGQLEVTAIDYFSGEITVSGDAIATQANLSFTLTPHIKIMPAQSGLLQAGHLQWLEYWLTDDGSAATELTTTGLKCTDRPPAFRIVPGILPRLSATSPSTDGVVEVDVKAGSTGGVGGTSIFSTLLTLDEGEYTSKDAAIPAVLVDDPTEFTDDEEISFLVTAIGEGVIGLKIKIFVEILPVAFDF